MQKTAVIILAGGFGKRMESDLPKVLHKLHGKPLVGHVLDAVRASGVCDVPLVVVGYNRELVMQTLGSEYQYVVQEKQLGTGHAVLCAESILKDSAEKVLVLYGDMPFISAETIRALVETRTASESVFSMATVTVPDFDEWRSGFYDFGRVIRDEKGGLLKTVEKKDAGEAELAVKELNPCFFCFDAAWLWEHLHKVENTNGQKEYYLTDLVGMAVDEKAKIETISIDPKEALGVNTPEHLEMLHGL